MTDEILLFSKFAGKCAECGYKFEAGTLIRYNTFKKTAKHKVCPKPDYSGTEQRDIFEMWIQRAQEVNEC